MEKQYKNDKRPFAAEIDKSTVINLERGKIPPQAVDLEEAVLGAMMIDKKGVDEAMTVIRSGEVFYKDAHRYIFEAMLALYDSSNPIDLLTVSQQLKSMSKLESVGGDFYLVKLTQKVASSAHTEYHCRIIMQYYIKRGVIKMNNEIIELCYDESTDIFDLLGSYQNQFDSLVDITSTGRTTVSYSSALDALKKQIEILSSNTDAAVLVGVPTGLTKTDKHTGGYKPQDLIITAARPGMGKTAKVLKTVVANLRLGNPVGFISLEMSIHKLTARSVAIDTDFHLAMLLKTGFDKPKYYKSYDNHAARMRQYPLYIDDSGESDITDIIIKARLWVRKHKIKLLVIDYLQLMKDRSIKSNREGEISSISRRLKLLAKELDIPVIALAQLSRAVETRGGSPRPKLSDLRDSGSIEQDADIVEFIYRPGYYNLEMIRDDYDDPKHHIALDLGANTEINYAKYRDGSLATALVKWVGDKTKFVDVEDERDTVDYIDKPLPKMNASQAFDAQDKTVWDAE